MKINKILFLLLFFPTIIFSQHTIKVTFSPEKDFTWAILYKNAPTNTKYIAQSRIVDGDLVFYTSIKKRQQGFINWCMRFRKMIIILILYITVKKILN